MSLFVNAAPFEENSNTIENKKTKKSYIKETTKVKLPTITFNDDDSASLADLNL